MKQKQSTARAISLYLKRFLPILNDDFCQRNKIISAKKSNNLITVQTDNSHNFDKIENDEALFVSGIRAVFDIDNIKISGLNVKITTKTPHNIGQDAILDVELIGFDRDNINRVYEIQKKINNANNNEFFIPKFLFESLDFSGFDLKIAVNVMRKNCKTYNRYLTKNDVEIIDKNTFSYEIDELEMGDIFISNINPAYLKSLSNVIEVRDLQSGLKSVLKDEDEGMRKNTIMVSRTSSDVSSNSDNKNGTNFSNFHLTDSISVWALIDTYNINQPDHQEINDIFENIVSNVVNLMSQFQRANTSGSDYIIQSVSYNSDSPIEIVDQNGIDQIAQCQEIKFTISKLSSQDKFDNLDLSFGFNGITCVVNGLHTPVV